MIVGDPQGTQARAIDTERQHPTSPSEEAPASFETKQLVALAVIVAVGVLLWLLVRWL